MARNGSERRPMIATLAPSDTRRRATAAPMPVPPPVISAVFPENLIPTIQLPQQWTVVRDRLAGPARLGLRRDDCGTQTRVSASAGLPGCAAGPSGQATLRR